MVIEFLRFIHYCFVSIYSHNVLGVFKSFRCLWSSLDYYYNIMLTNSILLLLCIAYLVEILE